MISISCTNCKALLTIDDAFAGGVCRCQHCGTIQTVPAHAKGHDSTLGGGMLSGTSLGGSKVTSARDKVQQQMPGTGLDELADIVASSGLAGSGLSSRRLSKPPAPVAKKEGAAARRTSPTVVYAAAGAVVAVVAAVLFATMRGDAPAGTDATTPDGPAAYVDNDRAPAPAVKGPSFCGVALDGSTVLYVLDRGSGSREVFDVMKNATLRSVASLGADRKFQVIFWDNGTDRAQFPAGGPTYATEKKVDEARVAFDDIGAFGATDAKSALERAYALSPDAVVLATGKGPDLDADFAAGVDAARNGAAIKTYTFALGEGGSDVLKQIAAGTGAQYRHVTTAQATTYAQ